MNGTASTTSSPYLGKTLMANFPQPENVNAAQWRAVSAPGGRLLIIAGPGTGKTHTLTYRIFCRLKDLALPQKFCVITFTNKAAGEIKERVRSLCGEEKAGRQLTVGTFHSFCWQILNEHAQDAGLPAQLQCAAPPDIAEMAKAIWPQTTAAQRKNILALVSSWKSCSYTAPVPDEVVVYNRELRQRGFLDFDDLLLETLILLRKNPVLLREIQNGYPEIFVDEYQDINPVQHDLLKLLVGNSGGITAIGDPNQAIYGFRGSDTRFFESFSGDFPGAQVMTLQENYRSGKNILSASSQVIEKNPDCQVPALTAQMYVDGRLTIYEAATDKAEAEYVVHNIEKFVGGTSMFSHDSGRVDSHAEGEWSFGDIAVLCRLKAQMRLLVKAFEQLGIPSHVSGQEVSEEAEGLDFICPSRYDDITLDVEKVTLMTLHASKGLEFPVVFIVGCEECLLPLHWEKMVSDREEERRLFYVGMTRAKERLFLTRARKRVLFGKTYQPRISPFLTDIEDSLKDYEEAILRSKKRKKEDEQMSLF